MPFVGHAPEATVSSKKSVTVQREKRAFPSGLNAAPTPSMKTPAGRSVVMPVANG